ncbi:MAG: hypothetical protein IJ532_06185 [Alphaproteobacteria bacterium]|nr:hypothetical protein [Alphaproteobacteria bacterium]
MKYRNIISVVAAFLIAAGIVGASYKSWFAKNINVTFHSVNTREASYKLCYAVEKDEKLSTDKCINKKVKIGKNDVKIILQEPHLSKIRLYLGSYPGVINLSKLRINGMGSVKLDNFAENKYENADSVEVKEDNSVTIISEQNNPYMIIDKTFNIYEGYDINWIKLVSFFCTIFVIFYAFFMLALYKKKKKKKEFFDYY